MIKSELPGLIKRG